MKTKRIMKPKKKQVIYAAIVVSRVIEPMAIWASNRDNGTWSGVLGTDKEKVVAEALRLKAKWEVSYGPYDVLIGTLNERVLLPTAFKIVEL